MGSRYEVTVFGEWDVPGTYRKNSVYMGDSLLQALWVMWKCRNDGTGCVSLNYRRSQP